MDNQLLWFCINYINMIPAIKAIRSTIIKAISTYHIDIVDIKHIPATATYS